MFSTIFQRVKITLPYIISGLSGYAFIEDNKLLLNTKEDSSKPL